MFGDQILAADSSTCAGPREMIDFQLLIVWLSIPVVGRMKGSAASSAWLLSDLVTLEGKVPKRINTTTMITSYSLNESQGSPIRGRNLISRYDQFEQ